MSEYERYLREEKDTVNLYARVLGLSREGMRFLENKGIIYPERDEESGYKVYGLGDSFAIIIYKKYRRFGFELSQIRELMQNNTEDTHIQRLEARCSELRKEIAEKEKVLRSMLKRVERMQLEERLTDKYELTTRPALYWMETRKNMILLESQAAVRTMENWNRTLSAFADPAIVWSFERMATGDGDLYGGQLIDAEDAEGCALGDVHYSSQVKCLQTVRTFPDGRSMSLSLFSDMLEYMQKENLKPAGDGIARQIRMYVDEKGTYQFVWQLMAPVL